MRYWVNTRAQREDWLYFFARALVLITSLVFALVYTKHLGLADRGSLTFIISTNMILIAVFLSGISFSVRNSGFGEENKEYIGSYLNATFLCSLIAPVVVIAIFAIYAKVHDFSLNYFPIDAMVLYSLTCTLYFGLYDVHLINRSLKLASLTDILVISIQISTYSLLVFADKFSFFTSVLYSYSLSYLLSSALILIQIFRSHKVVFRQLFRGVQILHLKSTTATLLNFSNQVLERADKLFLGVQTGPVELGRFSTFQSVFTASRFFPESLVRLNVLRGTSLFAWRRSILSLCLIFLFFSLLASLGAHFLVPLFLGSEWLLPFQIIFSLALIEFFKNFQYVYTSHLLQNHRQIEVRRIVLAQLIIGLFFQPILIHFMGLYGTLLCSFFVSLVGLLPLILLRSSFKSLV